MKTKEEIKERRKKYCQKNKEKIRKQALEYYYKNKEKCLINVNNYNKKTNYTNEKTQIQRKIRHIKRETRRLYPLKNQKCKYCGDIAKEHHHNTYPFQIHKFEFVCHKCHKIANQTLKGVIKNDTENNGLDKTALP